MPYGDGTGPEGEGPGTGRGMGNCPHCGKPMGEDMGEGKESMAMRRIIEIAASALADEAEDESEGEVEDAGEGMEEPGAADVRATALRMRS